MKRQSIILPCAVLTSIVFAPKSVRAQVSDEEFAHQIESGTMMNSMSYSGALDTYLNARYVIGAPYTAIRTTTTTSIQSDGTIDKVGTTSREARDAEGRVWNEKYVGDVRGAELQAVEIYDPVGHKRISWNMQTKVAKVSSTSEFHLPPGPTTSASHDTPQKPAEPPVEKLGTRVFHGVSAEGTRTRYLVPAGKNGNKEPYVETLELWHTDSKFNVLQISESSFDGKSTWEWLGTRTIKGIDAEGRKSTHEDPVGKSGNDHPAIRTEEDWSAVDTKKPLLQIIDDPKTGKTTKEWLGVKTINGINVEGTRITMAPPPSNSRPDSAKTATRIEEFWSSPELNVIVLATDEYPNKRVTRMELTKIDRVGPESSIFEIPDGYAIDEANRNR